MLIDCPCMVFSFLLGTARQMEPRAGVFELSAVPSFVAHGASRFIKKVDSPRLERAVLTDISPFLPKIVDIPQPTVSEENSSENRMQTRASNSASLARSTVKKGGPDIEPSALTVAVVYVEETGGR